MGQKDLTAVFEYEKSTLSPRAAEAYERMLRAFSAHRSETPPMEISAAELQEAYYAVCNDHPELFWLSPRVGVRQASAPFSAAVQCTVMAHSVYDDRTVMRYAREIEETVRRFAAPLSATSDEEKERRVCEYLVQTVTYEIDVERNQNAAAALCGKRAQCSGIAKAAKLLLDATGVQSLIVTGEAKGNNGTFGPHAWNIVYIGGVPYHLDVTMMLGANPQKQFPLRWHKFNETDAQMQASHRWDTRKVPPCRTPFACGDAGTQSRTVSSLAEFRQMLKEALAAGTKQISFVSAIKADGDRELMALVSSACRTTAAGKRFRVTVGGKNVTVTAED